MKVLAWTPAQIADLKYRLETLGETPGMIARLWGVTKNTVVGKASRMGFKRADVPIPKKTSKPRRVAVTRTWTKTKTMDPMERKAPGVRELKMRPGEPNPLGEQPGGCQLLHGPATKRAFCGHPAHKGTSWCEYHYARTHIPGTEKKKTPGAVIEK